MRCAAIGFLLILPGISIADDESWVGQRVVLKQDGTKYWRTQSSDQRIYYHSEIRGLTVTVIGQSGQWLWILYQDQTGWLLKSDAVLVRDAAEYLTNRIRKEPSNFGYYDARGIAWYERKEYEKAIADFTEAIRLNPTYASAFNNRGRVWHAKKDLDKAIKDCNEAIRLNPTYANAFNNRGRVWQTMKEFDKAIKDFTEAIRLDPTYVSAYNNRGYLRSEEEEFDKAIEDYTEVIRIDRKSVSAYNNRGYVLACQERYEKAIEDYTEAIRLDPKCASAFSNRAWLRATCPDEKYRDGKGAIDDARKACDLSQWKNGVFIAALAAAYAEDGKFDEAVKWQKRALEDEEVAEKYGAKYQRLLEFYESRKSCRE